MKRVKRIIFLLTSTLFLFSCANESINPTGGNLSSDVNGVIGG